MKPTLLLWSLFYLVACENSGSNQRGTNDTADTSLVENGNTATDHSNDNNTDTQNDDETDTHHPSGNDSEYVPIEITPGSYALPAPNQCLNQFWVDGCEEGNPNSACEGICTSKNACESGKEGATVGFLCPRFMLFSKEMEQAVKDDSTTYDWTMESPFKYAIAGHDADIGGLDDNASSCCECYQLVLDKPENQVRDQETDESTVPIPKPLIVQSFNTAAGGGKKFDIFMAAGGFGAFNGCDPDVGGGSDYQYLAYPDMGQPSDGGVKAVGTQGSMCKTEHNLVTMETLSAPACQDYIENQCNLFESVNPQIEVDSQHSCIESNKPDTLYHQNWEVLARRINCPAGITQVTGCKLVRNNTLPDAAPDIQTAEQARAAGFAEGYGTTTMQDCCKPSCAWQDWVTGQQGNLQAVDNYNSFYSCDAAGHPFTED